MKICKGCNKQKPFTEFYKNKKSKDGLHHKCLECYRADYNERRAMRLGMKPKEVEQQDIKKVEILNISKLFSKGKVTVRAKVKANHSLLDINWPCCSNAEADCYIDQLYNNPARMAQRYLERQRRV